MSVQGSDRDILVGGRHVSIAVELDADRALGNGGIGIVTHDMLTVEVDRVVFSDRHDGHVIPVGHFQELLDPFGFDRIALSGNVGRAGHISLEGTGDADLNLFVSGSQEDACINGAMTHLEIEVHDKVFVFFLRPDIRPLLIGPAFEPKYTILRGPPRIVLGEFPAFKILPCEGRWEVSSEEGGAYNAEGSEERQGQGPSVFRHKQSLFGFRGSLEADAVNVERLSLSSRFACRLEPAH